MVISKKKTNPVCTQSRCNDGVVSDKREIFDNFNKLFVNVGANLAAATVPSNKNPLEYMTNYISKYTCDRERSAALKRQFIWMVLTQTKCYENYQEK